MGIVIIVFAVLQIVLFFKLWGMTNNVQLIKDHMIGEQQVVKGISLSQNLLKEIYKKNPNIESILFESLYKDMYNGFRDESNLIDVIDVKNKYRPFYQKAELKFPDVFENINDWEDWMNTFENN